MLKDDHIDSLHAYIVDKRGIFTEKTERKNNE